MYKAKVTYQDSEMEYVGITNGPFKTRYNEHTSNFRIEASKNKTTLAKFVHDKILNPSPPVKWQIMKQSQKIHTRPEDVQPMPNGKALHCQKHEKYTFLE